MLPDHQSHPDGEKQAILEDFTTKLYKYFVQEVGVGLNADDTNRIQDLVRKTVKDITQRSFSQLFKDPQGAYVVTLIQNILDKLVPEFRSNPLKKKFLGRPIADEKKTEEILDQLGKKAQIGSNAEIVAQLVSALGGNSVPPGIPQKQTLTPESMAVAATEAKSTPRRYPENELKGGMSGDSFLEAAQATQNIDELTAFLQQNRENFLTITQDFFRENAKQADFDLETDAQIPFTEISRMLNALLPIFRAGVFNDASNIGRLRVWHEVLSRWMSTSKVNQSLQDAIKHCVYPILVGVLLRFFPKNALIFDGSEGGTD